MRFKVGYSIKNCLKFVRQKIDCVAIIMLAIKKSVIILFF